MQYKIIVDKQSRTNPSSEKKEYIVDIEELRVKGDVYDSLIITPEEDYVMRRLSLSDLNVLSVLPEPIKQPIPDINIELFEGDNYIYLVDMTGNKFYAEYLINNDFNNTFATRGEMNSAINQTAQSIELSVNQKFEGYSTTEEMNAAINVKANEINSSVNSKLEDYSTTTEMNSSITQKANEITSTVNNKFKNYSTTTQMNSAINQKANEITSTVSESYATKSELTTAKSEIKQTTDNISTEVSKKVGNNEVISKINQSPEEVTIDANKTSLKGKEINLTSDNITIKSTNFSVDKNGNLNASNANITGGNIELTDEASEAAPRILIHEKNNENNFFRMSSKWIAGSRGSSEANIALLTTSALMGITTGSNSVVMGTSTNNASLTVSNQTTSTNIYPDGVESPKVNQTSLESIKKNIKKYEKNASEIIRNSDIYEYNLKSEKDTDKKQIGFIIGKNYRTPDELTNQENTAIVLYSAIGLLWKSNQEQQKEIESLKERITALEGRING